jgi:hypothetical protein
MIVIVAILVASLIPAVLMIIPFWRIYARTGQAGALSLLMLIPVVNIIMLYVLAFADWPLEREANEMRARLGWPPRQ